MRSPQVNLLKIIVLVCLYLIFSFQALIGQDAFFTHFNSTKSYYNPAAVGLNNAFTAGVKYKTQWNAQGNPPFRTMMLTIEDGMPCSKFDLGINFLANREGSGNFSTYQFSGKIAHTVPKPFKTKKKDQNVLKLGIDATFGKHFIDFDQLIFSDQIHYKYGFQEDWISEFSQPNNNSQSPTYFNPGAGFLWKYHFERGYKRNVNLTLGGSISNRFAIGEFGNTSSILDQANIFSKRRYSVFAQVSFLPFSNATKTSFSSITPLFFYQNQSGLEYFEVGFEFNNSNFFSIGFHIHSHELLDNEQINWWSGSASINFYNSEESITSLNFTFSNNISGVQNLQFGPIFELGITYHLNYSPICKISGSTKNKFENDIDCYDHSIINGKIYEDIWYKN